MSQHHDIQVTFQELCKKKTHFLSSLYFSSSKTRWI